MLKKLLVSTEADAVLKFVNYGEIPNEWNENRTKRQVFKRRCESFRAVNGKLFLKINAKGTTICHLVEVIPIDDKTKLHAAIECCHIPGHFGRDKTYALASQKFFGVSKAEVNDYISRCHSCARHEPLKQTDDMKSISAGYPRERYQIDLVDVSQHKAENDQICYLMNVIDCFSKFAWSIPLQKKTKEQVGYALKRLFLNEGAPKIMHMDNGKEFVNEYFEGVCAEYSTCIVKGRPRHPQSQGQIERFNQTICRAIAKTICANNTKRWLDSLDEIIGAYNRTIHRATKFSPILLFKGTTGSPLITEKNDNYAGDFSSELANIREKAAENAKIYRANMVRRASVHRKKKVYLPGQSVLLKRDFDTNQKTKKRKFQSFYQNGIATIEKANTNNSYNIKIEDEEGTKIVIAKSSQLKVLKK